MNVRDFFRFHKKPVFESAAGRPFWATVPVPIGGIGASAPIIPSDYHDFPWKLKQILCFYSRLSGLKPYLTPIMIDAIA
jgi:hypothetical protein